MAQLILSSIVADQIMLIVKIIYFRDGTADCDYLVFTSVNIKVYQSELFSVVLTCPISIGPGKGCGCYFTQMHQRKLCVMTRGKTSLKKEIRVL